jgi:hypothetical protein
MVVVVVEAVSWFLRTWFVERALFKRGCVVLAEFW